MATMIYNPENVNRNFSLSEVFSLPKLGVSGKQKFLVYALVYVLVYPEKPINTSDLIKVNQVNNKYIKELVIIELKGNKSINARTRASRNYNIPIC